MEQDASQPIESRPSSTTSVVSTYSLRKRRLSSSADEDSEYKRPRRSETFESFFLNGSSSMMMPRFPPSPSKHRPGTPNLEVRSRDTSRVSFSRMSSPSSSLADVLYNPPILSRSKSLSDVRSASPAVIPVPECSAKHHMKLGKVILDFSVCVEEATTGSWPVGWSQNNVLLFSRGNRVHGKNLSTTEEVIQLCKVRDSFGKLRLIECAGIDQPNVAAFGTSKGYVQLFDIATKKLTTSWQTGGVTCMKWNGPVLTTGGPRGALRNYDTRMKPGKDGNKKLIRHQAQIYTLAWHQEGKLMASGDGSGLVHCWDARQDAPLEVGEIIQRRKKMQHEGPVTALNWAPWSGKILASGDSTADNTGTIRIWDMTQGSFMNKSNLSAKLEVDAKVTSLHFSQHCREILSTHGTGKIFPHTLDHISTSMIEDQLGIPLEPSVSQLANSVMVHSYPSMRHVSTISGATKEIVGSLMGPSGTKIVLAVPEESKLKIGDVWAKPKVVKRQGSFMNHNRIR